MNPSETGTKTAWLSGVASYALWGAMPLYWRLFAGTSPFIVFLHRCLWSFPFLLLLAIVRRQQGHEYIAIDRGRLPWLALSAFLIGSNWWLYIYGVETHQVVEMSLGYFFSPLLTAAMGVVFLNEKLSFGQWFGIAAVVAGVALYGINVGHFPMLALGLALTFSFYSLVRKVVRVAPIAGLTTEAMMLFGSAVFYLITTPGDPLLAEAWSLHATKLVVSGLLTALPLLWFAIAVRGLTMTTLGMLNYISPTGKFIIATLVFGEIVSVTDLWAFGLIWAGIVLYLTYTYQRQKTVPQPE